MIDAIYAWLERQKRQSRHDVSLLQAITVLSDPLAAARDALLQAMAAMGATTERAWRMSQRGGDQIPVFAASGARKGKR